jgi:heparosan-N-sulfate-glucuronate 5-epimerase
MLKSPSGAMDYVIKYVADDIHVRRSGNELLFGYGSNLAEGVWKPFTRNLLQDVQKAVSKKAFAAFVQNDRASIRATKLQLNGVGCVTNVSIASSEHLKMFYSGADWLLKNQDRAGGWPVEVVFNKDRKKFPFADELAEGWHSAMAQGHAMSVLSRAWLTSKEAKYADAAIKAIDLFSVSSEEGGFVAKFLDKFIWYEEYPTAPSSFVLNGFMYSLIGLNDLKEMLEEKGDSVEIVEKAGELLVEGLKSLRALLPLYDTGSGSVYDLRHFTMKGSAPKLARWDYHSTHVNLLYVISTLDEEDDFLLNTAERWRGYMVGNRAEHN